MEVENSSKYQKLATEYSKLRAQASVLKKAVIEEQSKNASIRETLRVKESSLRKSEQEVDSLGFRNKQLERRVASLQEQLELAMTKPNKHGKVKNHNESHGNNHDTQVISEELQKKIIENAQLINLIDDKNADIQEYQNRLEEIQRNSLQNHEIEIKLRKEIELLATKNGELESKLSEVASTIGSEDALSVNAEMDNNSSAIAMTSNGDERIIFLERELNHWRSQYELLKVEASSQVPSQDAVSDRNQISIEKMSENFTKTVGEMFQDKYKAESKLMSHLIEYQRLQSHLVILKNRLKEYEQKSKDDERRFRIVEDDLTTTRLNYEEQISVLTEQVINLSEQLANSK